MKTLKYFFTLVLVGALLLPGCENLYQYPAVEKASSCDEKAATLTILEGQSTSDAGIEEMLTDKIKSEFPTVHLEWECVDWGEQFASQMQAKFASSEIPDIIIGKAQDVAAYAPSGYLAPLDDSLTRYIRADGLLAATVNGKIYGAPYNADYQGVLYNKNLFWRYNIQPPKTLRELKKIYARFKEVGILPMAAHFQENWYIGNITMQFATNQVFLHDPLWGNKLRKGEHSFQTSKEFQACIHQVKDVMDNTWSNALTMEQSESDKRFAQGEAAMYLTGSWSTQAIQAIHPDLPVGIFPYPNETGDAKLIFEPNLTFMKGSKTANSALVDKILLDIFKDNDLAESIYDFTQTSSMLKEVPSRYPTLIRSDVTDYIKAGKTTDVTVGNTQLIWSFQDSYSKKIGDWLKGKMTFPAVLDYMDDTKAYSIQQE